MTVDLTRVKLGKLPHRHDPRTLQFARYLDQTALPAPPATLDDTKGVASWPMYANDRIGDCTCAAAAHMVEVWTTLAPPDCPSSRSCRASRLGA